MPGMLDITYRFYFQKGHRLEFPIKLDPHTLKSVERVQDDLPEWTALEFQQCKNCPLDSKKISHCPTAVRLVRITNSCQNLSPYEKITVEVVNQSRLVRGEAPAQQAISSLIGLIMATSGCPVTAVFKAMARYHMPLATEDETLYRVASMYFMAQYFKNREGDPIDMNLEGLVSIYQAVQEVNTGMAKRLAAGAETDSAVKGIQQLDLFSHTLPRRLPTSVDELKHMFLPIIRRDWVGE